MNKPIKINDELSVIVDENANLESGMWVHYPHSNRITNLDIFMSCKPCNKIIFTVGSKTLEGVPCLEDEKSIDNNFKEIALNELRKFYDYGNEMGYSNSELSRIRSCITKIKDIPLPQKSESGKVLQADDKTPLEVNEKVDIDDFILKRFPHAKRGDWFEAAKELMIEYAALKNNSTALEVDIEKLAEKEYPNDAMYQQEIDCAQAGLIKGYQLALKNNKAIYTARDIPTIMDSLKIHLEVKAGRLCAPILKQGKNPKDDAECHKVFLMLAHLEAISEYLQSLHKPKETESTPLATKECGTCGSRNVKPAMTKGNFYCGDCQCEVF